MFCAGFRNAHRNLIAVSKDLQLSLVFFAADHARTRVWIRVSLIQLPRTAFGISETSSYEYAYVARILVDDFENLSFKHCDAVSLENLQIFYALGASGIKVSTSMIDNEIPQFPSG